MSRQQPTLLLTKSVLAMSEESCQKTNRFDVCSKCKTVCCQDAKPPLTQNRKETIRKFLKEQKHSTKDVFKSEGYSYPSTDMFGFCALYSKETGRCLVHSVKPETCIAGPITFDINVKTSQLEYHLKKADICALAQELFENKDFLQQHLRIAKTEIRRLVSLLDSEALQAILKIEEPQTFKIDEEQADPEVIKRLASKKRE
jgi:Fe-S-cluster containining protein